MQILEKGVVVECEDGKFRACDAVLMPVSGGKIVVYLFDGVEVRREKYSRSKYGKASKGDSENE